MTIGALVLAAGQSKRFGGDKRQATLPNGKLVIQQTLEKVSAVFDDVLVVLRAEDRELRERLVKLFPDLNYHHAPDSELGMGHSLASGISQIEGWDGVFVFLGDMPFVEVGTLEQLKLEIKPSSRPEGAARSGETSSRLELAEQAERRDPSASLGMRGRILVPSYNNKPGHPVYFDSVFFKELAAISGDTGARTVIKNHEDAIKVIEVDDKGVLSDIDQQADLA